MKVGLLSLLLFTIYLSVVGFAKNLGGCPVHEYLIQAKIYNSIGEERVDQSCFSSSRMYLIGYTYQYNEESNDSV